MSTTRRRFIEIVPASAVALGLAACGERQQAAPPAAPAAAPAPTAPPVADATTAPPAPGGTAGAAGAVSETDPTAVSLGYVTDATRADKARFPKYEAGQHCGNCALYQGPADAPMAPCAIFGGRQVAGPGWCSAWTKRTA